MAQEHRRGSSVARPAAEGEPDAALANDGFDYPQTQSRMFKHRTLLDVKLKIASRTRIKPGISHIRVRFGITVQSRKHRNSVRILSSQMRRKKRPGGRAAPDKWQSVAHALLVGEADDLNAEAKPTA